MSQIIQNDKQFKKRESWQKWYFKNKDTRSKCVVCGSTDKLHAHHILHKAKYPELSLNVNNGIPLCKQHHDEVHLRRVIN